MLQIVFFSVTVVMLAKIATLVIAKQDTLEEIVLPVGGATLPGEKFVVRAFQTNFHEYNYEQFIRVLSVY